MGFDVAELLGSLFGGGPAAIIAEPAPATMVPEAAPVPAPAGNAELLARFALWVRRRDCHGRMGWEAPGLPESDRWWAYCDLDALPEPGPACPRCGSLELWQSMAGAWRCCHCDAAARQRSRELAELAARLREQAQPGEPAPGVAPGCVAGGRVDILDLQGKRPVQGHLQGLGGV
jgi:hypothetical protein